MQIRAYAKINWDLHILGKRADGFHELDSVMVNVSVYDTLDIEPAEDFQLTCTDPTLDTGDSNLVTKAAKALAAASGHPCRAHIYLRKEIPMGGGMGGGSSDAAAALSGLSRLWGLNWPVDRLQPIAAKLGSDVAFFLYGGWRRCRGRGEIVEPLAGSEKWPEVPLSLIFPGLHVPTPAVYKNLRFPPWDGKTGLRALTDINGAIQSTLNSSSTNTVLGLGLRNDLTEAAQQVEPRLVALQRVLQQRHPGRWLMSGSGSTHFVVTETPDNGSQLREWLEVVVGPGLRVLTATTFTP
jgi:4-diphosphocytidyl-2-C-methyl-D-erythritol kinase